LATTDDADDVHGTPSIEMGDDVSLSNRLVAPEAKVRDVSRHEFVGAAGGLDD
jgi:hypothetical protein